MTSPFFIPSLLFVITFVPLASQDCPPSDHLWCHEDHGAEGVGAEAFQRALSLAHSTNLSHYMLQKLMNDVILRFPCQQSSNNSCSNVRSTNNPLSLNG